MHFIQSAIRYYSLSASDYLYLYLWNLSYKSHLIHFAYWKNGGNFLASFILEGFYTEKNGGYMSAIAFYGLGGFFISYELYILQGRQS